MILEPLTCPSCKQPIKMIEVREVPAHMFHQQTTVLAYACPLCNAVLNVLPTNR